MSRNTVPAGDTVEAREHLIAALHADLVGPYDPTGAYGPSEELLALPPSRWYLTGFLTPMDGRELEEPEDDEAEAGSDADFADGIPPELGPKKKHFLPASIGLSVLLPPTDENGALAVEVRWARYVAEDGTEDEGRKKRFWRRRPQAPVRVELSLDPDELRRGTGLPGHGGIQLRGRIAEASAPGLEPGTRALSIFLVNAQGKGPRGRADEHLMFQVSLALEWPPGFLKRPNWSGEAADHADEQVADLQFRDRGEWAVGHGVAVSAEPPDEHGRVRRVSTTWIPRAEVRSVEAHRIDGLTIAMDELAGLSLEEIRPALDRLPEAYGEWIETQAQVDPGSDNRRRTRDRLLADARRARDRIREGIELLVRDDEVRLAFQLMNHAMAAQSRKQRPQVANPSWRLFQLAFVLLNLPSTADEHHADRETVELIYFPTGGGKTEAYLGVIATTLLLRRLRGRHRDDGGDGVAVILRYTLRLLTLDQLERASTLICALEVLRRQRSDLGPTRFSIGLWVGRSATANTFKEVAEQIRQFKDSRGTTTGSPFPLTRCPWCDHDIGRDELYLRPRQKPEEVVVVCGDETCAFGVDHSPSGLPVLFVDEQIYRELPAFLVATVDKFAMLPWRGETGLLFGRARFRAERPEGGATRFFGPLDKSASTDARSLPEGLRPPELVVQDELHLISGPLGTMVGLYETVIERLCRRDSGDGRASSPKILAATATVRQATQQVRALFGRDRPAVFPPPGMDDGETFFARVDTKNPGRLYVGVAAPGRAMKAVLLRTYIALLSAAQMLWRRRRGDATADAYMTLVGYFNSLRELGGMRRLVEDEVVDRCRRQEERRPLESDRRWFLDRRLQPEPVELTSREPTPKIADTKNRLELGHADKKHVDVLLASNMISVGVDITRLGLMVVAGQPKTTAEYIQASSRVGRNASVGPGLVVTCYNVHKSRDRSHYEHFTAYHESFYRHVEASSLTPFSGPALDRGLAGCLLAMTRLIDPRLTPGRAAADVAEHRDLGEAAVEALVERARAHLSMPAEAERRLTDDLRGSARRLLNTWIKLADTARKEAAGSRRYSPYDRDKSGGRPLLFTALDDDRPVAGSDDARFEAPTSMRDVEPTVHVWLQRQPLGGRTGGGP